MTEFYDEENQLNIASLSYQVKIINPSLVLISICYSEKLDLRVALEVEGIFSHIRLQRDLSLNTNGKQITLDPTQKELLKQLAKDENNPKTVVISGHEGSGKSLLAVEATKMKICSFVKQHPGENRKKIRVVLCAAYQGENRVPVLFQFLKEELKYFQRFCYLETKPLADVSFNSVEDLQSRIQKELAINPPVYTRKDDISFTRLLPREKEEKTMSEAPTVQNQQASNLNQAQKMASNSKIKKTEDTSLSQQNIDQNIQVNKDSEAETEVQEDKNHTIVLLDEVLPKFDLHQWKHLKSDSNVEYVVAIRHTFSQSSFPKVQRLKEVSILDDSNTLVCVLDKRLRCSNEITALVFYLMIHLKDNSTLKSFEHSLDSFNGGVPIWLDVENVEDFVHFANTNPVISKSVMVIYDPKDDDFSLQRVVKLCSEKKWDCHPCTSIVGSEAKTVFLYNLKDFHFESFTRVTTDLIIITINGKDTKNP